MAKVEILVDNIYGPKSVKYVKGDIVEVSDDVVKAFGDRCKVLEAAKPKRKTKKAVKNED